MADISAFLTKLISMLRAEVGDETFASLIPIARAHAGGVAKAEHARDREAGSEDDSPTQHGEARTPFLAILADPIALAEDSADPSDSEDKRKIKVQIFPHVGTYKHPSYGDLDITPEFLADIKRNFDQHVYNQSLPLTIDLEHQSKLSGAAGYITDLELHGQDGADGLWAEIELNNRGWSLVKDDAYRNYSPEYYDEWTDPATGEVHRNVMIGGALTARPFFKGMQPIYIANERVYAFSEIQPTGSDHRDASNDSDDIPAPEEAEQPEEHSEEKVMSIDPKEFAELQSKYASLESALAEERTLRETAQNDAKAAAEQIAQVRRENSRRELAEIVRNNRCAFKGEVPEVVDRLERLQTALSAEDWAAYIENQKILHTQLAESELLKQRSAAGEPALADFDSKVQAKVAAGVPKPQAIGEVARENPKLYSEHVHRINRRAANPE